MNVFRRRDEKPAGPAGAPEPNTVPTSRDPDLGAPRLPTRDNQTMSLATKPPGTPAGPTPPSGTAIPPRPTPTGGVAMPGAPASAPPGIGPAPRSVTADRRTLVVGRGISLQGTVAEAERLVVEGMVESQMIQAAELSISETGVFKGEVQVEDAEIAGTFDGTITARTSLIIRASGRVVGVARCRKLMVEEGGQISGRMEMLDDNQGAAIPAPRPVPAEV
jgi:cytoskeletal protein CcmA (bactofilin family)